jgi:hypothetical protein
MLPQVPPVHELSRWTSVSGVAKHYAKLVNQYKPNPPLINKERKASYGDR